MYNVYTVRGVVSEEAWLGGWIGLLDVLSSKQQQQMYMPASTNLVHISVYT